MAVEQKYEELMAGWNAQLEAKAEEFEELRSQLAPPRDLDVLRVKIREELEVEYQEKLQSLQAQTVKYQDAFFNVRREHEMLKTEFNQFTIDHGQEVRGAAGASGCWVCLRLLALRRWPMVSACSGCQRAGNPQSHRVGAQAPNTGAAGPGRRPHGW